jgi:mRNA interferase HicA
MSRLPSLRPKAVISALAKAGFVIVRIRGSHYQLFNPANGRRVTVPYHSRELTRATLSSIIHQSGLSEYEFRELL